MSKHVFLLLLLFAAVTISAQEVISTQGESYANSSANIDFTIGEVVINTGTDGTIDLTQGFHQTNWSFVGLENISPSYEAIIFPNPIEDVLNVETRLFENVTYSIYDAQGKLVSQNILSAELTSIPVGQLAPGIYSLTLNNEMEKLKVFKLIKHQK